MNLFHCELVALGKKEMSWDGKGNGLRAPQRRITAAAAKQLRRCACGGVHQSPGGRAATRAQVKHRPWWQPQRAPLASQQRRGGWAAWPGHRPHKAPAALGCAWQPSPAQGAVGDVLGQQAVVVRLELGGHLPGAVRREQTG